MSFELFMSFWWIGIGIVACVWIALIVWKLRKNSFDKELKSLFEDSRKREAEGEKWEEYFGNGR